MGKVFKTQRTVRFGECDPAGVVYYPVYFDWFHQTMEMWFEDALEISYAEVIKKYGFPAVETSASYRAPVFMGEVVDVLLSLKKLGKSSVRFQMVVMGAEQKVRTIGMVQTVCIPIQDGKFQFQSSNLPDELRNKMALYVEESSSNS